MEKNRNREKKYDVYYLKKYGGRSKEKNIFHIYLKKYENREKHIERQKNTYISYIYSLLIFFLAGFYFYGN